MHFPRSVSYGQSVFPGHWVFPGRRVSYGQSVALKVTIWSRFGKGLVKAQAVHLGRCISYGQSVGESPSTERACESRCVPMHFDGISGKVNAGIRSYT